MGFYIKTVEPHTASPPSSPSTTSGGPPPPPLPDLLLLWNQCICTLSLGRNSGCLERPWEPPVDDSLVQLSSQLPSVLLIQLPRVNGRLLQEHSGDGNQTTR